MLDDCFVEPRTSVPMSCKVLAQSLTDLTPSSISWCISCFDTGESLSPEDPTGCAEIKACRAKGGELDGCFGHSAASLLQTTKAGNSANASLIAQGMENRAENGDATSSFSHSIQNKV